MEVALSVLCESLLPSSVALNPFRDMFVRAPGRLQDKEGMYSTLVSKQMIAPADPDQSDP